MANDLELKAKLRADKNTTVFIYNRFGRLVATNMKKAKEMQKKQELFHKDSNIYNVSPEAKKVEKVEDVAEPKEEKKMHWKTKAKLEASK